MRGQNGLWWLSAFNKTSTPPPPLHNGQEKNQKRVCLLGTLHVRMRVLTALPDGAHKAPINASSNRTESGPRYIYCLLWPSYITTVWCWQQTPQGFSIMFPAGLACERGRSRRYRVRPEVMVLEHSISRALTLVLGDKNLRGTIVYRTKYC